MAARGAVTGGEEWNDQTFSDNVLESAYDKIQKEKSCTMSNEDNLLKRTVYEEEELPVQGEGRRQDV